MSSNSTTPKNADTPKSVIEMAAKKGAKMVDIKFVDTFGTWQHFSCPIARTDRRSLRAKVSALTARPSAVGKAIEASDMLAMPDPDTAFIDPFCAVPTLSLTCTIAETGTKEAYTRDPRGIAQRAEKYLASTGLADQAVFGPEAEFFIFDNVQYDHKSNGTFYSAWTPRKRSGTPAGTRCPTSATRSATRKVISRSPPPIPSRISAPRCA